MKDHMNVKETIKYLRSELTSIGLTLKIHKRLTINSRPAYYVDYKHSNDTLISNCTLDSLLNNYCSGYLQSLKYCEDQHSSKFENLFYV